MPRDGSGIYTQPFPDVVPTTTIESAVYNGFVNDVETDLNAPRPIVAGGTGANNAHDAMIALSGEIAKQGPVTNYDSFPFEAGSFYSDAGATAAPNGQPFSGICYKYATNNYMVLEARELLDGGVIGKLFVRQKGSGTWGAWVEQSGSITDLDARYVNLSGDTMTGGLTINVTSTRNDLTVTGPDASGAALALTKAGVAAKTWYLGHVSGLGGFGVGENLTLYSGAIGPILTYEMANGNAHFISSTTSSSPTTGALTVAGGIGASHIYGVYADFTRAGGTALWAKGKENTPTVNAYAEAYANFHSANGGYACWSFGGLPGAPYNGWCQVHNTAGTPFPMSLNPLGGNVGVGAVYGGSPSSSLHVSAPLNDGIKLTSTDGTLVGVMYNTGGTSLGFGTLSNHGIAFYSNNAERMRLWASGGLGIGAVGDPGIGSLVVGNKLEARGGGTTASQYSANISARSGSPSSFEWGHSNSAGYGSTLGYDASGGQPFLLFNGSAGATANTYRTYGIKGSLIRGDHAGGFYFGSIPATTADNQASTQIATITPTGAVFSSTAASTGWSMRAGTVGGGSLGGSWFNIQYDAGGVTRLWVDASNIGVITVTSDYRIKKDVIDLPGMWDTVKALRPIKYTQAEFSLPSHVKFVADEVLKAKREAEQNPEETPRTVNTGPLFPSDDIERWGFVAHELQATLVPSAAHGEKDSPDTIQSPNPFTIIAALTKALQEAMTRIEALEAR